MNCTTYTNSKKLERSNEARNVALYDRLKHLYPCVDDISELPKTWSADVKAGPLGLTCDQLGCYFRGSGRRDDEEKLAAALRTDKSIPPSCLIYYYEIKFVSKGREGYVGVGIATEKPSLHKLPGWEVESYGYHADDGYVFGGQTKGERYGPSFTTGDVIGCGFNLVENKLFFTKNGEFLGFAFERIPSHYTFYPVVGMRSAGEEIRANFGQEPFVYDIDQDLRSLRKNMTCAMSNYPVSDFSTWQTTLHKLVQSWLLQNSYPNTAEAFTKSTKIECKENFQRIHQRNRIQQCILDGRIGEAIRLTNRLCPNLLQNNPNLLFALRCRQLIELIGGSDNDYQSQLPAVDGDETAQEQHLHCDNSNTSNGNGNSNHHHNQHHDLTKGGDGIKPKSDGDNLSSSKLHGQNHNGHMIDADDDDLHSDKKFIKLLEFGRELNNHLHKLNEIYGRNEANERMLQDAIGLIAFTDPRSSTIGKALLDPSERDPISQLLNTSIVKAEMGDMYRPPLEEVMNHLRKLVKLNDSQGRWLVDKLYLRTSYTPSTTTATTTTNNSNGTNSDGSSNSSTKRGIYFRNPVIS